MTWQTPEFVEIDMSAEIGGYQGEDFGPDGGRDEYRAGASGRASED
jgi:hypothetical protein